MNQSCSWIPGLELVTTCAKNLEFIRLFQKLRRKQLAEISNMQEAAEESHRDENSIVVATLSKSSVPPTLDLMEAEVLQITKKMEATQEAKMDFVLENCLSVAKSSLSKYLKESMKPLSESKRKCGDLGNMAISTFVSSTSGVPVKIAQKYKKILAYELKSSFTTELRAHEEKKTEVVVEAVSRLNSGVNNEMTEYLVDSIFPDKLENRFKEVWGECMYAVGKEMDIYDDRENMTALASKLFEKQMGEIYRVHTEGNNKKFEKLREDILKDIEILKEEYVDMMDDFIEGADMRKLTPEILLKKDKRCRSTVRRKLPQGKACNDPDIQGFFHNLLDNDLNSLFEGYGKKLREEQKKTLKTANSEYQSVWKKYTSNLRKELEVGLYSDADLLKSSELLVYKCSDELVDMGFPEYRRQLKKDAEKYVGKVIKDRAEDWLRSQEACESSVDGLVEEYRYRMQKEIPAILGIEELAHVHNIISEELKRNFMAGKTDDNLLHSVDSRFNEALKNYEEIALANVAQHLGNVRCNLLGNVKEYEATVAEICPLPGWEDAEFARVLEEAGRSAIRKFKLNLPNLPEQEGEVVLQELRDLIKQKEGECRAFLLEKKRFVEELYRHARAALSDEMDKELSNPKHTVPENGLEIEATFINRASRAIRQDISAVPLSQETKLLEDIKRHLAPLFWQKFEEIRDRQSNLEKNMDQLCAATLDKYDSCFVQDDQTEESILRTHEHTSSKLILEFWESAVKGGIEQVLEIKKWKDKLESGFEERLKANLLLLEQTRDNNDRFMRQRISGLVKSFGARIQAFLNRNPYISQEHFDHTLQQETKDATTELRDISVTRGNFGPEYENIMQIQLSEKCEELRKTYRDKMNTLGREIDNSITGRIKRSICQRLMGQNEISDSIASLNQEFLHLLQRQFHIDVETLENVAIRNIENVSEKLLEDWNKAEPDPDRLELAMFKARKMFTEEMEQKLGDTKRYMLPKMFQETMATAEEKARDQFRLTVRQTPKVVEGFYRTISNMKQKYVESNSLMAAEEAEPVIGIDLGTTYSCVSIYRGGKAVMISDRNYHKFTTPSYVLYHPGKDEVPVGESAKDEANVYPQQTIFDAKRLIGRHFDDKATQEDIKSWPFKVINSDGRPKILVGETSYFPEQISSKVLEKLKGDAEKFLERSVEKAVITVPAYFTDAQKSATRRAGTMAGLKVTNIISEPTAAAIAYSLTYTDEKARNILAYDLGGGTFDVSVLMIHGGDIQVRAVHGDNHLGGEDIDTNLLNHCISEFYKHHGIWLNKVGNEEEISARIIRIRHNCEKTKIKLSDSPKSKVIVDHVLLHQHLQVEVTKEEFNEMNKDLFHKTFAIVNEALLCAKLTVADIDEVILVGGSSRIPKLQEMLGEMFPGKRLNMTLNPDEVVAQGAAIHAAIKSGNSKLRIKFRDVAPISLGIEVDIDRKLSKIIDRNTPLPCEISKEYTTVSNYQTQTRITIYEGEDEYDVKNNNCLGEFLLTGIPPARKGIEKVEVTMSCDDEGILHVTAVSKSSGSYGDIVIESKKFGMTEEEVLQAMET